MSYQFINETPTIIKVIDNGRELLFKKVYCSTSVDGDYFIFNVHNFENSIYRQTFYLHYTECDNPSESSAVNLKTTVDKIINNYAYGSNEKGYLIAYDTHTQSPSVRNTGYAITYSDVVLSKFIGIDNSRIIFDYAGIYNLQFSIQLTNSDTQIHECDIWFKLNGSNIDWTNSRFSIVGTHGGDPGHHIAAWNFMLQLNDGDYLEMYYQVSETDITIETFGASYDAPNTPSVILTVDQIA